MRLPTALFKPVFWIAVLAVAWVSLAPSDFLPKVLFSWWDKAEHALAYAVLGALGCLAYPGRRWSALAALLVYGGAIEVIQHLSGWRFGDLIDWLADGIGLALGALAAAPIARRAA